MPCDININKTFILEPYTGETPTLSGCSGVYTNKIESCSGDTSIKLGENNISIDGNIIPETDNNQTIGSPIKRFRNINTFSGHSTYWTADEQVKTKKLNLGEDSSGEERIITANNSIISGDTLYGGTI